MKKLVLIIGLFSLCIIFNNTFHAATEVTNYSILPKQPVKGDLVVVELFANPYEAINVTISYSQKLDVINGEFIWNLGYIEIIGKSNYFSIFSNNLTLLRVTTTISGIPITQTDDNLDGVTFISKRNIEPGKYWLQISGEYQDELKNINIEIFASTIIETNENGFYTTSYNTSLIPSGEFYVVLGEYNEIIQIKTNNLNNKKPIAIQEHTQTAFLKDIIIFNASNSYDIDGHIENYYWNLGDESKKEGRIISHQYNKTGNYLVILKIVDDKGVEATSNSTINIIESDIMNGIKNDNYNKTEEIIINNTTLNKGKELIQERNEKIFKYIFFIIILIILLVFLIKR